MELKYDELIKQQKDLRVELKKVATNLLRLRTCKYMQENTIYCNTCKQKTDKYNYQKHILTKKHVNNLKESETEED